MNRLTHFYKGLYFDSEGYNRSNGETDKLGKLEDIEEELGIDLITLYKALTNGIWVKNEVGQIYHTNVYIHNLVLSLGPAKNNFCFISSSNNVLLFNRINQDWALDKKELEK